MSRAFDVDPVELRLTGARLRQLSEDSRTGLGRLRADVESLLGAGWKGAAASAFRASWTAWQAATEDALTVLAEYGDLLVSDGQVYLVSDDSASSGISTAGSGA